MLELAATPPPVPVACKVRVPVARSEERRVGKEGGVARPGAKLSVTLTVLPVEAALIVTGRAESVTVTLPVVLNERLGVSTAREPMAPEPVVRTTEPAPAVALTVHVPVIVPEVAPERLTEEP